jgi:peptidoglycan/LPS O-acetylase OafA/YrhL
MLILGSLFIVLPHRDAIARVIAVLSGITVVRTLAYGGSHDQGTFTSMFFMACVCLSLRSAPGALVRGICELPFLRHLGKYSYALYVVHHMMKVIWMWSFGDRIFSAALNPWLAQTLYVIAAGAGTYALARFSWVLLERPCLTLKDKLSTAELLSPLPEPVVAGSA